MILRKRIALALLLSTLNPQLSTLFAQGSLTPSGAPAPTMKTLQQVEPRTPISSVPFVITQPGSYYLITNLVGVSGTNGIVISTGNVAVDLNGFALLGVPGSAEGILVAGSLTNITVRNGIISGWGSSGLSGSSGASRGLLLEQLTVSANSSGITVHGQNMVIRNCLSESNHVAGIQCFNGVILDCVAEDNGGDGIFIAQGLARNCVAQFNGGNGISANSASVLDCVAENNDSGGDPGDAGILVIGTSVVRGCLASLNGIGTNGVGILNSVGINVVIEDCVVEGNANDGIRADSPCVIIGNTANSNGGGALASSGIHIPSGTGGRVEGNLANGNSGCGIRVDNAAGSIAILRNSAGGNATNYFPGSGLTFAPIQSPATMTNAWGNMVN